MEATHLHSGNNEKVPTPRDLAQTYEAQIKAAVANRFGSTAEKLRLLLDDQSGVYFSEKESDTLCILVLDEENGPLYLVTGKITGGGKELVDFKSDPIS